MIKEIKQSFHKDLCAWQKNYVKYVIEILKSEVTEWSVTSVKHKCNFSLLVSRYSLDSLQLYSAFHLYSHIEFHHNNNQLL